MKIVDPANPIPKYLQISAWLKELISTGRYQKGEKLPSEIRLAEMCTVNRNTLRQALSQLAAEGLLIKEKGRGTFISSSPSPPLKHKLKQISSFRDDLASIGIKEKTLLVKKNVTEASQHVADALVLGVDNKVITIHRLRTGDGIPFIYEESYLPFHMFKDILEMDLTGSMYQLITERFNIVLARCEQTIQAVNLNGKTSKYLHLPENSAGIFMESVTFDANNIPVEVLCSYYRGDKYIFEVELGRYHIRENPVNHFIQN
ncbi:MAG: GntR family transcriptional regulator [Thermodesulfobacteriota bacterium]